MDGAGVCGAARSRFGSARAAPAQPARGTPARPAASDKKDSEGRGGEAPATGKPDSAGTPPLLWGLAGPDLRLCDPGFHRRKGAPCGGCVPFHPPAFQSGEDLLQASILFPNVGLVWVIPALEVQLCGWGAGPRVGVLEWGRTDLVRPGHTRRRDARGEAVGPGEFPRVVGGGEIRSGQLSCGYAPGSQPRTRTQPPTRLLGT